MKKKANRKTVARTKPRPEQPEISNPQEGVWVVKAPWKSMAMGASSLENAQKLAKILETPDSFMRYFCKLLNGEASPIM